MSARAKELFLEALDLDEASRSSFLDESCRGDVDLRKSVERLLGSRDHGDALFGRANDGVGERIGPFTLRSRLGEGGFAVVWLAEQFEPVRREVALKLMKSGLGSPEVTSRFEAERQALALMDHPSIAKVFDGGATQSGIPWFAMERVDGSPITDFVAEHELTMQARLDLFLEVCRAVEHAHQKGVVHRDIKPSNVLVALVDGRPRPTVIDFGIAKALKLDANERTLLTRDGQIIGTPAYMAPEQIGESLDVDTRADVYSLGVLLYELLSGTRPFSDATLANSDLSEILRLVREVEPPRPSASIDELSPLSINQVRGDLDWIAMRCLEKDRERRYGSVAELALDIQRHLAGKPVSAGPPGLGYRTSKFVARHRWALIAAGLVLASLVIGLASTVSQLRRARAAEKGLELENARAELELERFGAISDFLEEVLLRIDPTFAKGRDTELLRIVLDSAAERAESENAQLPLVEATVRRILGGAYRGIGHTAEAEAQLTRALELRERELAPDHLDLLESLHDLGVFHAEVGKLDIASTLLERTLEGHRRQLGRSDERTLTTQMNLGHLRRAQGRLDEAEELLLEVERERTAQNDEIDADTLRVKNALVSIASDRGDLEAALPRLREIARLQHEVQGPDHPETLMALNNLAQSLSSLGQLEEAEHYSREALAAKRRILPEGHSSMLVGLNNLAHLQMDREKFVEAEATYREALRMIEQVGSQRSRHATVLRMNFAGLLVDLEREGEALELHAQNAEETRAGFGVDDPLTIRADSALAWRLTQHGEHERALELSTTVLERAKRILPPDEPGLGVHHVRHGLTLLALDRDAEARESLETGLRLVRAAGLDAWIDRGEAGQIELEKRTR